MNMDPEERNKANHGEKKGKPLTNLADSINRSYSGNLHALTEGSCFT